MSITVVLQQMIMIFILIGTGMFLYKKEILTETGSRQISGIIVNVTNPALLICSALSDGPRASLPELGKAFGADLIIFALLIACSFLLPRLLRVPRAEHYAYQLLTVFGNVGFIGIPLASAVLGTQSLIFVSIFNLIFNLCVYTFGISLLHSARAKEASLTSAEAAPAGHSLIGRLRKLINIGTVSAVVTILLYVSDIRMPMIVSSTLTYMGQSTTFLSMIVLGVSVAQMAPRDIFTHPKLYGFVLLRQILIPIGLIALLRPFIDNALLLGTLTLMLAVPAANMPLMLAKQMQMKTETISQGIILTTLLSLFTIPLVSLFLSF